MARNNDNGAAAKPDDAPENVPPVGSSLLVMQALGDHAATIGLQQGEAESEIDFAVRCIEVLGQSVAAQDGEIKALKRQIGAQKGMVTKARAAIVELEEAGKPRAIGAMAAVFDDEGERHAAITEMMTAIDGAHEIVLAFSDGQAELRGIKPRQVRAEAFRWTRGRLLFTDEPLEVTGPGGDDTVTMLAGVALLVDGEQVGWAPMPKPINIGAGQTINLAGSVIFG